MSTIIVVTSSPAKAILSGEHSVVYGEPALTVALSLRTRVRGTYTRVGPQSGVELRVSSSSYQAPLVLQLPAEEFSEGVGWLLTEETSVEELTSEIGKVFPQEITRLALAFAMVLRELKLLGGTDHVSAQSLVTRLAEYRGELEVEAPVPQEAGLGSSAAYFGCLLVNVFCALRAVLASFGPDAVAGVPDPCTAEGLAKLEPLCLRMETLVHGKTTGVDVKTIFRGGLLAVGPQGVTPLVCPQALSPADLILADTGERTSTAKAVAQVKGLVDAGTGQEIIKDIGWVTRKIQTILAARGLGASDPELSDLLKENQTLLAKLGLATARTETLVKLLASHGVPAKTTGKGLGGYVLALCPPAQTPSLLYSLSEASFPSFKAQLDPLGLTCLIEPS